MEYCQHIQKYRSKFKTELDEAITATTAFYVYAPNAALLKWDELSKLGLFTACLYQNDFIDTFTVYNFTDGLARKSDGAKQHRLIKKLFLEYYNEILSNYPKMLTEECVLNLDTILSFDQCDCSDRELEEQLLKIKKLFFESLKLKDLQYDMNPSFVYFIDNSLNSGCEIHKWTVYIDHPDKAAKFFLKQGMINPYTRFSVLVRNLTALKDHREAITKQSFTYILPALIQACKNIFYKEFYQKIQNAKRPIGITKFIGEFFKIGYLPLNDFYDYFDKICELTLKKPTKCLVMCFYNILDGNEKAIHDQSRIENIKRVKEFIEERIQKENLIFTDENLDSNDLLRTVSCPLNVYSFKLLLAEFEYLNVVQQIQKIKDIGIYDEKCLKMMSEELLKDSIDIKFKVKIVKLINENFPKFQEILQEEIVRMMREKIRQGFGNFNKIIINTEKKNVNLENYDEAVPELLQDFALQSQASFLDDQSKLNENSKSSKNHFYSSETFTFAIGVNSISLFEILESEPEQIENFQELKSKKISKSAKKRQKAKKKAAQAQLNLQKSAIQHLDTQLEQNIKENLIETKKIYLNPQAEVQEFENLLNFSIELFNFGWISIENFQIFLEFFIAEENFEIVLRILKSTSKKLLLNSKILQIVNNLKDFKPKSSLEYFYLNNVIGQFQDI